MDQKNCTTRPPDLRQRRTRKYLSSALIALLQERPLSQISVVDICRKAMVHRTTFYAHFNDKQELLRWTVVNLMREEFSPSRPTPATDLTGYFLAIFQNALDFMQEHNGLFQAGDAGNEYELLPLLENTVATELCQKLSTPDVKSHLPDLDPELTSHFYAGAILFLIRWWMETDGSVSRRTLLRHLNRFLSLAEPPQRKG